MAVRHGLYTNHIKQLEHLHHIAGQSDRKVLDKSGLASIEAMILRAWLHWTGHVIWMDSSCIACELLYEVLMQGHRNQSCAKGDKRTASKSLSNILVSMWKTWNLVPMTEQCGMPWQREHSSMLSTVAPEKEERPQLLLQIQTQLPSSVTYALTVPHKLD